MRAYVINLPATVDPHLSRIRRDHITSELRAIGLEHRFVDSVDGLGLTSEVRAKLVDEATVALHPNWLTPGVIGACLSHVEAYREILADGDDMALILEDDVVLPSSLPGVLRAITSQVNSNEIVLLYWRTWEGCEFSTDGAVGLPEGHQLMFPMDARTLLSAVAYIVTRDACRSMIEAVLPIRTGADVWGEFHEWGGFERIRCVVPRAVSMRTDFKSTLDYVTADSISGQVTSYVARHRIFPMYQLLAWRRAHLERRMTRFTLVAQASPLAQSRG